LSYDVPWSRTDIPIASGESEFTRFDFRDLIDLRAIDILQAAAVASSGFILEYSLGANPMLHASLALEDFPVVEGMVEIPDRPGLGVTIDEGFVRRHRVRVPPSP
jgi:L-alanine-DL-glutamate epimerase-like enolase superfamily enzyme